jgi:RNA polymerase sigma-70 factor (ECF subfamily)
MAEIVAGNESAFGDLIDALRPLVRSIIKRTLGNPNDVDDVCQTVFLSLWKRAKVWDPSKGRVSSWVATISRNRAIDHVRKSSRAAAVRERLASETAALEPLSYVPAADDQLLRSEARRTTRHALRELAPEQRQAIELAYFEDLTQAEVAERSGLALGTAKSHISRGMMTLRRRLPHRLAA